MWNDIGLKDFDDLGGQIAFWNREHSVVEFNGMESKTGFVSSFSTLASIQRAVVN